MSEIIVIDAEKLPDIFRQSMKFVIGELLEQKPISEIMTKSELAEYLRCDVSKINRFMKKGLPFVMFGDTPRFYRTDIDKWLKRDL